MTTPDPKDAVDDVDVVNHPRHYSGVVPGVECIEVASHFSFCIGNAMKYLWRYQNKGNPVQDLQKAIWYIQYEIEQIRKTEGQRGE